MAKIGQRDQSVDTEDDPYSERYVAFVDILGFSEIVARNAASDRVRQRARLARVLKEIGFRGMDESFGEDFRYQQFSDSIIISERPSLIGLTNLLDTIVTMGVDLVKNGLLIRGGISKGPLCHQQRVVFGPAFLDAYKIESTISDFPRVVLSKEVYHDTIAFDAYVPTIGKNPMQMVKLASDGPAFVDIFHEYSNKISPEMLEHWRTVRRSIESLLENSRHDPRHYRKMKWLAFYWNSTVGTTSKLAITLNHDVGFLD